MNAHSTQHACTATVSVRLRAVVLAALLSPSAAWAQPAIAQQDHSMHTMPGMQMDANAEPKPVPAPAAPKQAESTPSTTPSPKAGDMADMRHGEMAPMDHAPGHGEQPATPPEMKRPPATDMGAMMKSMQGGSAPPDARDPDAYADGLKTGRMAGPDMADDALYSRVMLDRVEAFRTGDSHGQAVDAQAWIGGDIDKLWFKLDGERTNGKPGATRTEALWDHAVSAYWGLQTGIRHDFGDGPARTWAAFGIQGLAPYWFDLQATAYVGQNGRTALRFETEYDLLITQRLILQPNLKVNLYGSKDIERGTGAGLSDVGAGLRLRYEFSRKVAPYVGVVWSGKFGDTARYARDAGSAVREAKLVAGVRIWF